MSMTKRWIEKQQDEFARNKYSKDGCPDNELGSYNWDTMVRDFYEGNYTEADADFFDLDLE